MRNNPTWSIALTVVVATLATVVPSQAGSREKVIYSFQENTNGAYPVSRVILASNGNLYGTAELSGKDGAGTVFQLTPVSGGWKVTLLHTFNGVSDGGHPRSGLLLGKSGRLYGTAFDGGSMSYGTVFELTPGSGCWSYQVIHNFTGGTDGGFPSGDLIADARGNLYGTTAVGGGSNNCNLGCGTVFQLKRSSRGEWTEKVLYSFQGGTDGLGPLGALVWDQAGNLYGLTSQGGSSQCFFGCGTAFKLSRAAKGRWQKSILHAFADPKHGQFPYGGLTFDREGNLYGTTYWGGNLACNSGGGCGTVFRINPQGEEAVIYRFPPSGVNGMFPMAGLVLGGDGRLYGTTFAGGKPSFACGGGCGTIFAATISGKLTTLHAFNVQDGAQPEAPLFWDSAGHLYGTTFQGGTGFVGVVFEVTP